LVVARAQQRRNPQSQRLRDLLALLEGDQLREEEASSQLDDKSRHVDDMPVTFHRPSSEHMESIASSAIDDASSNSPAAVADEVGEGDSPGLQQSLRGAAQLVVNAVWATVAWLIDRVLAALPTQRHVANLASSSDSSSDSPSPLGGSSLRPPTDQELRHRGLGFASPPTIIADEIQSRVILAQQLRLSAAEAPPKGVPSEVQLAVAMARAAQKRDHVKEGGASSESSPYSLGKSLPRGVSWRYVDVLAKD